MTDSAVEKAVRYAENRLKVHRSYGNCESFTALLDATLQEIAFLKSDKRSLETSLEDAIMELTAEEAGNHPGMSVAALDRHLKIAISRSGVIKDIKAKILDVSAAIDRQEAVVKSTTASISVETARMNELGGYLTYLAAAAQQKTMSEKE